jgi:hypothetical protein
MIVPAQFRSRIYFLEKCLIALLLSFSQLSLKSVLLSMLVLLLNYNGALLLDAHSEDFTEDFTPASDELKDLPTCKDGTLTGSPSKVQIGTLTLAPADQTGTRPDPCKCLLPNADEGARCKPNGCVSNKVRISYQKCEIVKVAGQAHRCEIKKKEDFIHTSQISCNLNNAGDGCDKRLTKGRGGTTSVTECKPCKTEVLNADSDEITYRAGCMTTEEDKWEEQLPEDALKCTFIEGHDGYINSKNDCKLRENRCQGECKFKYLTAASACKEGEEVEGLCMDPASLSSIDQQSLANCG